MLLLTRGTLVLSEYLWLPHSSPCTSCPLGLEYATLCLLDCFAYWNQTDFPRPSSDATLQSEVFPSQIKNTHRKSFIWTFHGSLPRNSEHVHTEVQNYLFMLAKQYSNPLGIMTRRIVVICWMPTGTGHYRKYCIYIVRSFVQLISIHTMHQAWCWGCNGK